MQEETVGENQYPIEKEEVLTGYLYGQKPVQKRRKSLQDTCMDRNQSRKGGKSMCVGLAAKVVGMKDGMAIVDASGAKREVSAELLDDLEPGDYVMVHAGIAIAKIDGDDESEAEEIIGLL